MMCFSSYGSLPFFRMESTLGSNEAGLMTGLSQNPAGPSCGKPQLFDWSPHLQHLQYTGLTSRGRNNTATPTASSIHPLVPLLLYSDRHFPPSCPFSQTSSVPTARQTDGTYPRYDSNSVPNSRQPVKKPLNAFMLYMKEMRQQVLQEGRETESAAINRILGRRWNALSRSEQSKYYDLAQKERLLHMQLYPGWSARDNYGKKKRKPSRSGPDLDSTMIQFPTTV